MQLVTGTLDADAEYLEIYVLDKATAIVTVTSTITVTPHISHDGAAFVAMTADALTASGAMALDGPAVWRLVASGVAGGSAVCSIQG